MLRTTNNYAYRVATRFLLSSLRRLMSERGVEGAYYVSAETVIYELRNLRLRYKSEEFGTTGNIDSGGNIEAETVEALLSTMKSGYVFYDVGAHGGLFSLCIKKSGISGIVYAFDPLTEDLNANLRLNGIDDVAVFECAVGDEQRAVTMETKKRSSNHIAIDQSGSPILVRTLDSLASEFGLLPPTHMKLDIEGYEIKALLGAESLLRHRPVVVTEINQCVHRYHQTLEGFSQSMLTKGYTCHRLYSGSFEPIAVPQRAEQLPPSADSNYWWLPD